MLTALVQLLWCSLFEKMHCRFQWGMQAYVSLLSGIKGLVASQGDGGMGQVFWAPGTP